MQFCAALTQPPPTPNDFDYQYLHEKAEACGGPPNTVTLSPCSLCGKGIRMPDASQNIVLYNSVTCGSFDKQLSEYWSDDAIKCNLAKGLKIGQIPDANSKFDLCKCPATRPPTTTQTQAPATGTYVVKMTLSLPMSKADFTGKQTLFKKSIAAGALHVNVCCLCVPIVLCSQACEHITEDEIPAGSCWSGSV